ncbi:hypothetical protein BGZ94_005553 [Podila epigama]|nr:hypothetical protein BGZ94_005553 [Podila epigama]
MLHVNYKAIEVDQLERSDQIIDGLNRLTQGHSKSFPNVFVKGTYLGGREAVNLARCTGQLQELLHGSTNWKKVKL